MSKNVEFRELYHHYTMGGQNPLKKIQTLMAAACNVIRTFYVILTKGVEHRSAKMIVDIKRPMVYL